MSYKDNIYTLPDADEVLYEIGKGGYGKVCLVKHEGEILARKEVRYRNTEESKVDYTINEIDLLKGLKHRNVVNLVDYYIDTDKNMIYIYTRYYDKGDLWSKINEKKKSDEYFSTDVYFYLVMLYIGDK